MLPESRTLTPEQASDVRQYLHAKGILAMTMIMVSRVDHLAVPVMMTKQLL